MPFRYDPTLSRLWSRKTVTVRVSAPQAGNLEVALSYTVPGASWVPSYDARVLSSEHAVALGYFGLDGSVDRRRIRDIHLRQIDARRTWQSGAERLTQLSSVSGDEGAHRSNPPRKRSN